MSDLREALKALCDAAVTKPYGTYNRCMFCGQTWWDDKPRNHDPKCSVKIALQTYYAKLNAAPPAPSDTLRAVAEEVYRSIPATYDEEDPMVHRHGKALLALGVVLEAMPGTVTRALAPAVPIAEEPPSVDGPNAVEVDEILGKPHYSVAPARRVYPSLRTDDEALV